ncbi:MAG TPA: hypothetical protein PKN80_04800 [bacterium]|uniref:Uncharacterized protein n=1 Tax=candidate division TA06 bacterium ADurb.Bin417 TaxID=1852828 RepID=A0A1V5MC53_UNCT6|nr:MAG: hypothetical protein BWY73_01251 [candidate division TA06 bacterium ADurb.Bin417]HNQ35367.1 hypothetical protein [bacterium]HNS47971.1 hypothetical protein [bacterium]
MKVLGYGLGLFLAALLAHILIWRLRRPARRIRVLCLLFPVFLAAGLAWLPGRFGLPGLAPSDYLEVILLDLSLAAAYLVTYPALEVESPSMLLVLMVGRAGRAGLDPADPERDLDDRRLVEPRLKDLERSRLVVCRDGCYRLTPAGRRFVGIFVGYRNLFRPEGGG